MRILQAGLETDSQETATVSLILLMKSLRQITAQTGTQKQRLADECRQPDKRSDEKPAADHGADGNAEIAAG